MGRDEIPLLVILVPLLVFVIWLKGIQVHGNREVWRSVFRSWRRALRLPGPKKKKKRHSHRSA